MAVWIGEVKRLGRHPGVIDRPPHGHTVPPQGLGGALYVRSRDGESNMLGGPGTLIFLEYDHASLPAGAQEQPVPARIS
jgi:hypothetical protein